MENATSISVEVQSDHIERQSKAKPIPALSELIWNALDGDANNVSVELARDDLAGGLSKIVVYDDGHGFSRDHAIEYFKRLGGSWKRQTRQTKQGREVHGQEGRGRYKALALGGVVTWHVCADHNGERQTFDIEMAANDLQHVEVGEAAKANGQQTGVVVEIENLHREFKSFTEESGRQQLTEIFALYLMNYSQVSIAIDGQQLDPTSAIEEENEWPLAPIVDEQGKNHQVNLHIIQWKNATERKLYLCTESGFPLEQAPMKFHVGDFSFSAYLKSSYISELHNNGQLAFSDTDTRLKASFENARDKIKEIFRQKQAERLRSVVEEWKEEKSYPYEGEATSPVEEVERQVFDIVAVNLQNYSPDLEEAPAKSRAFHLRMLKHAIERGPEELQQILEEVVQLPKKKLKELASLLQFTTLSSIITASKTVGDRLQFLSGLEMIVLDTEMKKHLLERTQLHKIVERNTWLFGDEYSLWVSDKGLKQVLERCRKHLAPDIVIDDPVKVVGQKTAIVDLMFSRQARRHRANDVENLIVELKRPTVTIGSDEITQIKKYAQAVAADERFSKIDGVRWHFWLVANDYDEYATADIEGGPDPERRLVLRNKNMIVGVKTWGEIIEENRARLQFFQEHLQYSLGEEDALQHLKERHAELLSGVVDDDGDEANTDNEANE